MALSPWPAHRVVAAEALRVHDNRASDALEALLDDVRRNALALALVAASMQAQAAKEAKRQAKRARREAERAAQQAAQQAQQGGDAAAQGQGQGPAPGEVGQGHMDRDAEVAAALAAESSSDSGSEDGRGQVRWALVWGGAGPGVQGEGLWGLLRWPLGGKHSSSGDGAGLGAVCCVCMQMIR